MTCRVEVVGEWQVRDGRFMLTREETNSCLSGRLVHSFNQTGSDLVFFSFAALTS